jgi:hemoglobin
MLEWTAVRQVGKGSGAGAGAGDLDRRAANHDVVVRFYREVVFDEVLAPVFDEVVEVDWAVHIPKLIDYWCYVLLGETGYDGALLAAHRHVHQLGPVRLGHLDRWYALWASSIDTGWSGPQAERAKEHARRIGTSRARRLLGVAWPTSRPGDEPRTSPADTVVAPASSPISDKERSS